MRRVGLIGYRWPTGWPRAIGGSSCGARDSLGSLCIVRRRTACQTGGGAGDVSASKQQDLLATPTPKDLPLQAAPSSTELARPPTVAEVEDLFQRSVAARTVSNAQVRRYLKHLSPREYDVAIAAVAGARKGGLHIDADTYEELLDKLMQGGQLRSSMELYQQILRQRITPTPNTYAALMAMCLQRDIPSTCQILFNEMQRRGARPTGRVYELLLLSYAAERPPKWEQAIEVFDKLSRQSQRHVITAQTYNALMQVYMNMTPFDWRVVYNCYNEMRHRTPPIPLEWDSYLIVREALRRGRAGWVRRVLAYLDAWMVVTNVRSWAFAKGLAVYFIVMLGLKTVISYLFLWYYEQASRTASHRDGESVLPSL